MIVPQVAMINSSQKVKYHVVSEKVKKIGTKSVVFVDFELGTSRLNLDSNTFMRNLIVG